MIDWTFICLVVCLTILVIGETVAGYLSCHYGEVIDHLEKRIKELEDLVYYQRNNLKHF